MEKKNQKNLWAAGSFLLLFLLWTIAILFVDVQAAYAFFEIFVVNYRPVLMDGCLEASYPSSTTFLVIGRLVSGVHWFTDIIGGALLSASLVLFYSAAVEMKCIRLPKM